MRANLCKARKMRPRKVQKQLEPQPQDWDSFFMFVEQMLVILWIASSSQRLLFSEIGGVYFVFSHQEGFRQPPQKHFVIHGRSMENQ